MLVLSAFDFFKLEKTKLPSLNLATHTHTINKNQGVILFFLLLDFRSFYFFLLFSFFAKGANTTDQTLV